MFPHNSPGEAFPWGRKQTQPSTNNASILFSNSPLQTRHTLTRLVVSLSRLTWDRTAPSDSLPPVGPGVSLALPAKSCRTPQACRCPKMSLPRPCNKHGCRENAGPFQSRELAKKTRAGPATFSPQAGEQQQRGPRQEESSSSPPAKQEARHAGRGSRLSPLPVRGSRSATRLLPTLVRCPSQQLCDHTQRPGRALAALPAGNYTLGANLLPLPGEAWGEGRRSKEKEADVEQHQRQSRAQTAARAPRPRRSIFPHQHLAALTPRPACASTKLDFGGEAKEAVTKTSLLLPGRVAGSADKHPPGKET